MVGIVNFSSFLLLCSLGKTDQDLMNRKARNSQQTSKPIFRLFQPPRTITTEALISAGELW